MSLVSIIIPVFNQWEYTNACLAALLQNDVPEIPLEIIIVDNASTDNTASGLLEWQKRWSNIKVERLESNTGFSPACNHGARSSAAPYLLFLNNDTIPQANWLKPLLEELQNPEVGIVAPKLLYPDGLTINHVGYVFGRGNFYGIYQNREATLPAANLKRDYQALLGACILMKRGLFFDLGEFAEYGLEDIDLCLKAKEKNLKCRCVPESVVYHHGSVTLQFSESGSFPVMDAWGFSQRWGNHGFIWDDYIWYLNDGMWPLPPGPSPIDSANDSVNAVNESKSQLLGGNYKQALELLNKAISLWPQNPMAFAQKIRLLAEKGQTEQLIRELQRLPEYTFDLLLVHEIMPILSKHLPEEMWKIIKQHLDAP